MKKIKDTKINTYGAIISSMEIIYNYRDTGESTEDQARILGDTLMPYNIKGTKRSLEIYISSPFKIKFIDLALFTVDAYSESASSRVFTHENIKLTENYIQNFKIFSSTNNFVYKVCFLKELESDTWFLDYFGNKLSIEFRFIVDETTKSKYFVKSRFDTESRFGFHLDNKLKIESSVSRNYSESDNEHVFI